MRLAVNVNVWASTRLGIFFPAHNQTPADGNLTGQCVTLNKWFLHEMTDVPAPFSARGDARYVGQNLVAQGYAVKVPYAERRAGDFAIFEYGQYGHIGVLLDQDRIFEQNVNVGGVARKLITEGSESWYVYASRIGRLSESWRPVQATIYRIKSYSEEGVMNDEQIKQTALYLRLAAGDSLEKANANNANDLKQIKANIDYLPALAKQIYQGNEVFRWKASHYDEQVKAAHDQGFQEGEAQGGDALYIPVAQVNGKNTLYTKKDN